VTAFPEHEGVIARLQSEAAARGFDAAVVRREDQLQVCEDHFANYDVVLMDMPDFESPALESGPGVRDWVASHPGLHRHLVFDLAMDLEADPALGSRARSWNCDWVALVSQRTFGRKAKFLDLLEIASLPVSLMADRSAGSPCEIEIASGRALVEGLGLEVDSGVPEQAMAAGS